MATNWEVTDHGYIHFFILDCHFFILTGWGRNFNVFPFSVPLLLTMWCIPEPTGWFR
jgi:hypothetical protein